MDSISRTHEGWCFLDSIANSNFGLMPCYLIRRLENKKGNPDTGFPLLLSLNVLTTSFHHPACAEVQQPLSVPACR